VDNRLSAAVENIEGVIFGKREVIERLLVGLLAGGHILLEDVPGTGKTVLARSVARSLDLSFKRIQFTPDLLPSDVTGSTVFNRQSESFVFHPGPIFTHILLADEINRASPRTQSALLEAMAEGTVSVDGVTHDLEAPFMVMATQNPIEMEGTFPLPEAQLDRFLMKISVGYPDEADEIRMLRVHGGEDPLAALTPVLNQEGIRGLQERARTVHVSEDLHTYVATLARKTRELAGVAFGASPRGALALLRAAKALAVVRGRDHLLPDDVKEIAPDVLAHRLVLSPEALIRGSDPRSFVEKTLDSIPVPIEDLH